LCPSEIWLKEGTSTRSYSLKDETTSVESGASYFQIHQHP
jgi:hypothetical protein